MFSGTRQDINKQNYSLSLRFSIHSIGLAIVLIVLVDLWGGGGDYAVSSSVSVGRSRAGPWRRSPCPLCAHAAPRGATVREGEALSWALWAPASSCTWTEDGTYPCLPLPTPYKTEPKQLQALGTALKGVSIPVCLLPCWEWP